MSAPESLTEITTWKRYNDFKDLYKGMTNFHKALHRRDPFPPFAKPKLFGRFEEAVIEERRKSAIDLLVFIGSQQHLYNSKIFEDFLKGGKVKEGISGQVLKPSKLDIMQSVNTESTLKEEPLQPVKHPTNEPDSSNQQENGENNDGLDGVWNFPRVPDNISLNSYDDTDDSEAMEAESVLSSSLPEMDLTSFDPLKSEDRGELTLGLKTSSSWLFEAMDTCAGRNQQHGEGMENEPEQTTSNEQIADSNQPPSFAVESSVVTETESDFKTITTLAEPDVSDFDPFKPISSSVECGKGDLDLSWRSRTSSSSSRASSNTSSPRHGSKRSPSHRFRSATNESVSTMDLGGKEDYIYLAADQICLAHECEASSKFELAFSYYKSGVGILLQGVQSDKNKARRDAVRRKTAQYLMKAEDLYNRHLATDTVDDKRWSTTDNMLSPSGDLDPTVNLIKAPISEMKNLKVLGTINKVLLVMDKTSDETYVIKTIHKSSICSKYCRTIMPLSCPYMVSLHKFYETENAVYLLLQHATGGKLWNYIGEYLQYNKSNWSINCDYIPPLSTNVYSGYNVYSNASKEIDNTSKNNQKVKNPSDLLVESDDISVQNNFEDNKLPDTVSDISDLSDDKAESNFSNKPSYDRNESLSSEENPETNENLNLLEQREDVFQQLLLNSNQTNLENFSINSVDSNDSRPRMDSFISDNINIESIPEENEHSPSHQIYNCDQNTNCDNDVFNEKCPSNLETIEKFSTDGNFNYSDHANGKYRSDLGNSLIDQEAVAIVKNAKDLLKTVERTLSQTDREVNKGIFPDSVTRGLENKYVISLTKDELNDSSDTLTDHDEPSIYDINRSLSDSDSDNESKLVVKNSKNRSSTVQSSSSDKTLSKKTSRSSTLTDQPKSKPPKLARMNSIEPSRSASFEHELKSPHLTRQRTLSDVFKQLDLAMSSPDQVKIPESCIRQWVAEIIVAVSRLHAEGLICRDLRPDNILLGDNGHILLSYFCQVSLTDYLLNQDAEEQLYVAPEVNRIGDFTEVCDWWSVGTLLYELAMGRSLKSCHPGGITAHTQLYLPSNVSPEVQSLLHQLLCFHPKERLGSGINGSEDIKAHPFFSGIDWNKLEKLT